MWKKVIKVLKNALELAKADPADKQEIRRLTQENSDLAQELAAALAACPSNEDREQIAILVDEFAAAVPQADPVIETSAPVVVPDSSEPIGSGDGALPPTTPYPGAVGTPSSAPIPSPEVEAPVTASPADALPEPTVQAQPETVAPAAE